MAGDAFYLETALTGAYIKYSFGFISRGMKIVAEGGDVEFSFNGRDDHGKIKAADGAQDFNEVRQGDIWLKGANVRLFAWL